MLTRYTDAEVLYNSAKADRGAKESRLQVIDQKLKEDRSSLAPNVTNVGSPWIQKLKENLVEAELQYTELQLQNYSDDHPRMLELKT